MKKDIFDNIGKKLNEYQSPVDLDKEWSGVLKRQEQEKNKKIFFWRFSFLLIFLFAIVYLTIPYTKTLNDAPEVLSQNLEVSKNNNVVTKSNNATIDSGKEKNIISRKNNVITKNQKGNTKESIPSSELKKYKNEKIVNDVIFSKKENKQQILSNKLIKNITPSKKEIEVVKNVNEKIDVSKKSNIKTLPSISSFLMVPTFPIEDLELVEPKMLDSNRKIQIYFNSGLAITRQSFKAKETEWNEYGNLRSNSEIPLETYTYDLGINIPFGKKSFVSVGGNYNISFDKINHTYDSPKAFSFENVLIKIRTSIPSGTTEEIFGDTTIVGSQTISKTQFNKYTATNLNISVGHYLLSKKRFNIAVTGGILYNISLKAKGKLISPVNSQQALVEIDGYKKSFGLGIIGGLDFDYRINQSWIINLRPIASYGLFSASSEANPLNSNFYKYGISLGAKYNW